MMLCKRKNSFFLSFLIAIIKTEDRLVISADFFHIFGFHIGYSIFKRQKILSFRTNAAAINVIVILKGYQDIYMRTIHAYPDSGVSGTPAFSTDR